MYLFVVTLHVLLAALLVLVIVLQPGKGSDVGAAFGGGGTSTLFGPRGPTNLLQRATTVVAFMFMGTSLTLALYSNRRMMADANVEEELLRLRQEEAALGSGGEVVIPDEMPQPEITPSRR